MNDAINWKISHKGFRYYVEWLRVYVIKKPQLWVWLMSIGAWAFLIGRAFKALSAGESMHSVAVCMTMGTMNQVTGRPATGAMPAGIWMMLLAGSWGWLIMVVAMMFPLLNRSVRHVAFAVKQKDRISAILVFLIGYTVIWMIIGVLYLTLSSLLSNVTVSQSPLGASLLKASGFLLAGLLVWNPLRALWMVRCERTAPISIAGWRMYGDALSYGIASGITCVLICWAPMAALVIAHHNFILMILVSAVVLYERYLLRHSSKFSGYAWGLIALSLFITNFWF